MFLSDIEDKTTVFIDANIFVYHFTANSRFNPSCTNFLERVEKGDIRGIISASIVLEVTHRIMIEEAALAFPDIKPKDFVKYLKNHPEIVKNLELNQKIPSKITMLNIEIIPLDMGIIERSQKIKTEYGSLSNDAVILQIMKELNISLLASNDSDFDGVDFITVYKPV